MYSTPLSFLDLLSELPAPVGVFFNSDHLQTVTAWAADFPAGMSCFNCNANYYQYNAQSNLMIRAGEPDVEV